MARRPSNRRLVDELRQVANLETYAGGLVDEASPDQVRALTRLYRETFLAPLLDEIERRLCRRRTRVA